MQSEINAGGYPVEISGWDLSERFFVEKTTLQWDGSSEKEVGLRCELHPGSVVFVRLLHPASEGANFPVAYRADVAERNVSKGETRVRLIRMHPNAPFKRVSGKYAPAESLIA